MMERTWNTILKRYGQEVTVRKGEVSATVRAFLQPALDRNRNQEEPSPLGVGNRDRFLYLGPAGFPLDRDTLVEWQGQEYRVQAAHLVGAEICPHWWAVLYPRDEVSG